jgi:hypothetical protein
MQNNFESVHILENLQIYEILRLGHQNGIIDKDHMETDLKYFIKSSHGISEKKLIDLSVELFLII